MKVVSVISPRPPIWIKNNITNWPKTLQWVPVSTTTNPVTQVADVAVNNASKKLIVSPYFDAIRKQRSIVNNNTTIKKLDTIILGGESFIWLLFLVSKVMWLKLFNSNYYKLIMDIITQI